MQQKGEDMLTDFFHQENLPSNDENIKKLCNLHHVKNYDELTLNIGQGIFSLGEADKKRTEGKIHRLPTGRNISALHLEEPVKTSRKRNKLNILH